MRPFIELHRPIIDLFYLYACLGPSNDLESSTCGWTLRDEFVLCEIVMECKLIVNMLD